ncbi:diacylglycerol kinase zeta-like isoform X5 [Scomber scombrus]|uniref:Diacylglycerol kinase zeta-like isoform X5 n=1 Tax=Scomber scombrus TaxID=13677 RepID=A0AAV1Q0W1_SCOSC
MMRDSAPQIVERPGLEDVAEEEDVFAAEVSAKSALLHSSCQVQRGNAEMEEGQLSVSQVEAEFAQLTFRKQVSYRFISTEKEGCFLSLRLKSDGEIVSYVTVSRKPNLDII